MVTMEWNPLFSWTFGHKRPRTSEKPKNRRKSLASNDLGQIWVSVFEKRKNTDGASGRPIFVSVIKLHSCIVAQLCKRAIVIARFHDIVRNHPRIDQNRFQESWAVVCQTIAKRLLAGRVAPPIRFSDIPAGYPFGVWVADCNR